jgi:hypothetical protein
VSVDSQAQNTVFTVTDDWTSAALQSLADEVTIP